MFSIIFLISFIGQICCVLIMGQCLSNVINKLEDQKRINELLIKHINNNTDIINSLYRTDDVLYTGNELNNNITYH